MGIGRQLNLVAHRIFAYQHLGYRRQTIEGLREYCSHLLSIRIQPGQNSGGVVSLDCEVDLGLSGAAGRGTVPPEFQLEE